MYVSSNIETIYEASKKSKDSFIIRECVLSKLGEMLAKDKVDIIKSLRDRQLDIPKNGDSFVISVMLEQMKRSDDYCETLAKMLLKKDGASDVNVNKLSRELLKTFKDIANSDSSKKIIMEYREQVVYGDDEAKKLYADAEESEDKNVTEKLSKRKRNITIASIALGTIIIGGVIYYFIRKRRKKLDECADGMKENIEGGSGSKDGKIEVEGVEKTVSDSSDSDDVDNGDDFDKE